MTSPVLEKSRKGVNMELRRYRPEDLQEIAELFYETIHHVNRKDYSEIQIKVWSDSRDRLLQSNDFFMRLYTVEAVEQGRIAGYGNIDDTGYLDHLFVHKDFQRMGAASLICEELERYAVLRGMERIEVHASITAKPFFEKRGYRTVKEQQVDVKGILLTNFVMEKILS